MIALGLKGHYRVLHLTSEFGNYYPNAGGVTVHINEQYRYRDDSTGFLHFRTDLDFSLTEYAEHDDLAIVTKDDADRLNQLDFDILVVHYFGLVPIITNDLMKRHQIGLGCEITILRKQRRANAG